MILLSHSNRVSRMILIPNQTRLHRSENEVLHHLAPPLTDSLCSLRSLPLCYFCAPWSRSYGRSRLDLSACLHGSFCTVGPLGIQSRQIAGCLFISSRNQASALGRAWPPLTLRELRTINTFQPWEEQNLKNRPRRNYRRISEQPHIFRGSEQSNDSKAWAEDIAQVQAP